MRCRISVLIMLAIVGAHQMAAAQCSTSIENTSSPDREYMGLRANGERIWVGQEFLTDCDGKFLTVSFLIDVQLVPSDGIRNLTAGDALECTLLHDNGMPIATVNQTLTRAFGLEWVLFDFGFESLGLAAGTLAAKLSTPHNAYCLVGKSGDVIQGRMMQGNETILNYVDDRDMAFQATWDPDANIVGVETNSWGEVKALFR